MFELLPRIFGNIAVDLAAVVLIGACILHSTRRGLRCVQNAQAKRSRALTLRKTLELKSVEVAALRETLLQFRQDIEAEQKNKETEDLDRLHLSQLLSHRELDPDHADLEERLLEASRRSTRKFDA